MERTRFVWQFKIGEGKDYLYLYKYAALGAGKAQKTKDFKLGGPSTTALYNNWFDKLITFADKENLRLDFYSWHRYSKYISDYETDINNVYSWSQKYTRFKNIEFIISESGISSENSSSYDGNLSAIHTLSLYSMALKYENLKILTFEIKDGPGASQFWGRWGLITHEKFGTPIAKPRYKAIEFLNLMDGIGIPVNGQGDWVKAFATKSGKNLKILIVNYDPFGSHYENVPILLNNLPSENLILKVREFLGNKREFDIFLGGERWKTTYLIKPNTSVILELTSKD